MKAENWQKVKDLMCKMEKEKQKYNAMLRIVRYLKESVISTDEISIRSIGLSYYEVDKEHLIRFLKVEMTYAEKRIAEITKELEAF